MQVRVQVFASFREAVGSRSVELDLGERPTVRELLEAMSERWPALGPALETAMVAVNLEYVGREFEIRAGDDIGIIPPVSGGGLSQE